MNLIKNKDLLFDSFNLVNKCINTNENDKNDIALDTLKLFGKVVKKSIEQTTKTMFYNDNNFFEKMKNSKYTNFINKIKTLNIPMDEYKLPIIVNIGNESSGKSSLIRNILKCDIFPIDKSLATKCPIKIELFNSDVEEYYIIFRNESIKLTDIEKTKLHVSAIMNKIDDIVEDELYIKISNEYVINSTFYDLPGIIEYPAEMRDKSKNIINKYINKPNTLIICVIPANTQRLNSNQALGMINDANKTKDCIICLTMVDLLHNDDIEIFIDRILVKNNEVKNLNIKKIIGVISHKNKEINENVWFDNNLLNNIDDNSLKIDIKKNITLENLLISVDDMFNDFISTNWKKNAINKTNQKILELENEYNNLGKEISLKELFEFINPEIHKNIIQDFKFPSNVYQFERYSKYDNDINILIKYYNDYKDDLIKRLNENIINIFNIDNQYKYIRFELFKKFLIIEYTKIIKYHYSHIDIWFNSYIDKLKYEYNGKESITIFEKYILHNFGYYIYDNLCNFIIDFNNKTLITESDDWKNKRETLIFSINKYKKIRTFFENL